MFVNSSELIRNVNNCNSIIQSGLVLVVPGKPDTLKQVEKVACIVTLLSIEELKRYKNIGSISDFIEAEVENLVVSDKVVEIVGFPGHVIDLDRSPAGSISTLAYGVYLRSLTHITEAEHFYRQQEADLTNIDIMVGVISYYLNTPYQEVAKLPVNEIYKRYAIVSRAFPSQVQDPFAVSNELE